MNREVVLIRYPDGTPSADDFALREAETPDLAEGEALVRTEWLSMDPLPRVRMAERSPMGPPMRLGAAVEGRGGGRVVASRAPGLPEGAAVIGEVGWREVAALPADALTRIDEGLGGIDDHLGVLGASGLTAWFLAERAEAKPDETALVAPAAGSVGMIAGQLLARRGVRVAGIVGGARQADFVRELGFAAAVDHRSDDLDTGLAEALPDGWDAFLDGVGGATHDAALARMNVHARLVLFGFVSGYGAGPPRYGAAPPILLRRARAEGFLLADHADRWDEARATLAAMVKGGAIRAPVHVTDGLANAPAAFAALFGDAPPGKQLVRVNGETDD